MIERFRRDGVKFTTETVAERQWMFTAAAVHAYNTQASVSCVKDTFQACSKACTISGIAELPRMLNKVVREVVKLERSSTLKKSAAFKYKKVDAFVTH